MIGRGFLFPFPLFLPALLAGAPLLARGDGTFQFPQRIRSIPRPVSLAAGDFNRDRKLDLAVVGGDNRLTIVFQDPSLREWKRPSTLGVGIGNFSVRAADFDTDGDDDLVVADPASVAWLLLCNGDGSFGDPAALSEARGARALATGDFNGDGHLDLASANHDFLAVSIYLGRGDGTFQFLEEVRTGEEPHAIEALDYDGDRKPDLMVGISDAGLLPLKGAGDGRFSLGSLVPTLGCVEHLATGDFDRDGQGDLATTCSDFRDAFVGVSLGNGEYRPTLDRELLLAGGLVSPAIADLNGDGTQDLALASTTRTWLEVFPGKGDGGFFPQVAFGPTGAAVSSLISRDLDGDGRADLVSAENFASALQVFWGRKGEWFLESPRRLLRFPPGEALAIADLDRDGTPDLLSPRSIEPGISIRLRPGSPALEEPSLGIETAQSYSSLEAVDLDGDGLPDLAGVNASQGTALVAFLDPSGKVREEAALPAGLQPTEVEVGRLDGDDLLDLAVPCGGSSHIAVFLGQGGAFAAARQVSTLKNPRALALGDLDADGRLDLAVIARVAVVVHRGNGDGSFTVAHPVATDTARSYRDVAIAEVTGDAYPDLLVAETVTRSVLIFRGNGGHELALTAALVLRAPPHTLLAADLNGDGFLDLTTSNSSAAQSISVLLHRGAEGLGPPLDYEVGFIPAGHRVADLDLDGALDLVAFAPGSALILRSRPSLSSAGLFRRGDSNEDGQLEITDPILVLGWLFLGGPPLPCPDAADSTDDGLLDLSDPISTLYYLFLGGAPLPPPGPEACSEDPTKDSLPASCARC